MNDYPAPLAQRDHIEPVPRRIRAVLGGKTVIDTTDALYLWEWEGYPQFLIPAADVAPDALVDEKHSSRLSRGSVNRIGLRAGGETREDAGRLYTDSPIEGLVGRIRFDWEALDAWFEEDEQVYVHPRSPYVRVDALRSSREVRIELEGSVLADSRATVMVFETGLPTRFYFDRTAVDFTDLTTSETTTACPYKGRTTGYWSARIGGTPVEDIAWSYEFPTRQLLPIAGLIAFYNEIVDVFIDGEKQPLPKSPYSRD